MLWIIGISVNIITAMGLGLYFRVIYKSRFEKLDNENAIIKYEDMFFRINEYDRIFMLFIDHLIEHFGAISKTEKEFVDINQREQFINHLDRFQKFSNRCYDEYSNIHDRFLNENKKDINEFLKRIICNYLIRTNNYMSSIINNWSSANDLFERGNHALIIIDQLNNDKLISNHGSVKIFIQKWKSYFKNEK